MLIAISILVMIFNFALPTIWPNRKLDWLNYTAGGMLIAVIILKVMKG